jgi:endonuclease/exonuclease/phosphatase family metal-dependent hydrolase
VYAPLLERMARDVGAGDGVLVTGDCNAFRGDAACDTIDAVLAAAGWIVDAAQIERRQVQALWPSDHFPVTARVRRSCRVP